MKSFEFKIPDFSGFNEEYRKVQESIKQLNQRIQEAMRPATEHMRKISEAMAEHTRKISQVTAPTKELMQKISEVMERVAECLRELPDKTESLLGKLAEKGWFLPLDISIPAVDHLTKLIESNDDEQVDRLLVKFCTTRLDGVLSSLTIVFPERAHLFRSAFKAHKRKEYDLSIPVLLAQADGVCYGMLGEYLFARKEGIPKTKKALQAKIGSIPLTSIYGAFLGPLRCGSALMLNPDQMKEKRCSIPRYNVLNRHEIMHGIDKNYGSEVNSLKTIAQLDYLRYVQKILKNHEKCKQPIQTKVRKGVSS